MQSSGGRRKASGTNIAVDDSVVVAKNVNLKTKVGDQIEDSVLTKANIIKVGTYIRAGPTINQNKAQPRVNLHAATRDANVSTRDSTNAPRRETTNVSIQE